MRCRAKHLSRQPGRRRCGNGRSRSKAARALGFQGYHGSGRRTSAPRLVGAVRLPPGPGPGALLGGHRRPAVESQTPSAPSRTHRSATGCSCPFEGPGQGRRAGAGAAESARVIWATAAPVLLPKGRHARGRAVPPVPTHSTRKQRRRRGAGSGGGTSRFRQARWIGFGPATKFSLSVCVAEILMKLNRNR